MTLEIKLITDQQKWDNFVLNHPPNLFTQSWKYGQFNRNYDDDPMYLGIFDEGKQVGGTLAIKVKARRGTFIYLPYGPILEDWQNEKHFEALILHLKELGRKERAAFIKISPFIEDTENHRKLFKKYGFKNAPLHILAETTWILDVTPDEEEIMKGMRKNHRNLIRRATKDGVTISIHEHNQDILPFLKLHRETVSRHNFVPFSDVYIQTEFEAMRPNKHAAIFHAHYNNEIISSAIIMFYGDTAAYRHGASSSEYPKIPSSYLLLWEAIKEAKKRGCKVFNFWGVAPTDDPKHPFSGIRRFKTGFSGEQINLLHCQDFPLSWKYKINYTLEILRKMRRGF